WSSSRRPSVQLLPRAHGHPHLAPVDLLDAHPRGAPVLGVDQGHVRPVQRRRALDHAPGLVGRAGLGVALDDVEALHDHAALARPDLHHDARLALVLAGDGDDPVALSDARRHGYSTSGARLMIFMKFFSRSSRATGPKMRVPR